jgi:hypothetical protein
MRRLGKAVLPKDGLLLSAIMHPLAKAQATVAASPVNVNKPGEVRRYVTEVMDDMESIILEESTKKSNLEAIEGWEIAEREPCSKCQGQDNACPRCNGTGLLEPGKHPAAVRAHRILQVKIAAKEVELYEKLILAGKFHASFVVIGTLSSRMAGADGLNLQGIKHTHDVRRMFPLGWDSYILCGGDFSTRFCFPAIASIYHTTRTLAKGQCHSANWRA